ncbi:MAG: hypothetical protein QXT28_09450 [Thermofilaceae archaeon]
MLKKLGSFFTRREEAGEEVTVIDLRYREPSVEKLSPVILIVTAPSLSLLVEAFKKAYGFSKLALALAMLIPSSRPAYVKDLVYEAVRGIGVQYKLPIPLLIVDERELNEILEIAKRSTLIRRIPEGFYEVKVLKGFGLEPALDYAVWAEGRSGYAVVACHPGSTESVKNVIAKHPNIEAEFLSAKSDVTLILLIMRYDEGGASGQ